MADNNPLFYSVMLAGFGLWILIAHACHADEVDDFFYAIAAVESNHNDDAVGDGGASIGRYQIQRPYWIDSRVPGKYEQVRDPAYARRVMVAYWKRYVPEAWANRDWQTLARVHNGGPRGHRKRATLVYWEKVSEVLDAD